ncbi:MAG: ribonuclease P protein component [Alphaproteobacteria bacterium]|nr:ribonuclease P protein component [Alphaproteobacteria bacterium]
MTPPPEIRRLRARREFLFVRQGAKAARPTVMVEARRRPDGAWIGAGFTATKKIGNAVTRNRCRRRLREAARALLPRFGEAGVDYVFVARSQTADAAWARLLDDIESALLSVRAVLDESHGGRPRRTRTPSSAPKTAPKKAID